MNILPVIIAKFSFTDFFFFLKGILAMQWELASISD